MISGGSFPPRLTEIDDLTRPDHSYLGEDTCYFIGEYTARRGYAFSETNHVIINFKKGIDRRSRPEWRYKEQALQKAARAFRTALNSEWLDAATLVPVPPSKAKDHPLYDDRMGRMLRAIRPNPPLDIRELVIQPVSTEAVHDLPSRPRPEDLEALYEVDPSLVAPRPQVLAIVDDVLTTGAHYCAMAAVLGRTFPGVRIIGLFIARRVPDTSDVEDFF